MRILQCQLLLCWSLFFTASIAMEGPLGRFRDALGKRDPETDCVHADLEAQCSTNPDDCVAAMCDACQGMAVVAECCSLATVTAKLSCLANALANPSALTKKISSSTNTSTSSMSMVTIAASVGQKACAEVYTIQQSCQNETTGFSTASFNQQGKCLCYAAGTFNATMYDSAWSTCLAYASTTSPALYTSLTSLWGSGRAPCSQIGPVNNLSIATSSSVWYIGYTTSLGGKPLSSASDRPSAIATAAMATVTNGGYRLSLSLVEVGVLSCVAFFI